MFLLNRDLEQPIQLTAELRGFDGLSLADAQTLQDADLLAVNTAAEPDRIRPRRLDGVSVVQAANGSARIGAELPPASWTVVRLAAS